MRVLVEGAPVRLLVCDDNLDRGFACAAAPGRAKGGSGMLLLPCRGGAALLPTALAVAAGLAAGEAVGCVLSRIAASPEGLAAGALPVPAFLAIASAAGLLDFAAAAVDGLDVG